MALTFNGSALPNDFDITYLVVSTPRVDFRTVDIPDRPGLIRAGRKYGNRTVQIGLAFNANNNVATTSQKLALLYAWLQSNGPAPLYIPGNSSSYLLAECDTFPPMNIAKPFDEFQIAFTCHRPEFFAATESHVAINNNVTIGGALPVWPEIRQTISSAITNPIWSFEDGSYIELQGEVDAGNLVISCDTEKVTLDGVDITSMVTLASTLGISLAPGQHRFIGAAGAGGSMYWRNATLWG